MIIAAGLVVISNNTILLVKQKNCTGRSYSIPKGLCLVNENLCDSAIRETYEETGIRIHSNSISGNPYVMHYSHHETGLVYKRIYYYVAYLDVPPNPTNTLDSEEIESFCFFTYEQAERNIFIQQLSVLLHLDPKRISTIGLRWLLMNNFILEEKHPYANLYIYNYTEKTKNAAYWNEMTLWARGMIVSGSGEIIAYPLKKFFEFEQLLPEFRMIENEEFDVYEKVDGCLGILYWLNGIPKIATRDSFVSHQSYKASLMLYSKYREAVGNLNQNLIYYFEIIYPEKQNVISYGSREALVLLGAHDCVLNSDIRLEELSLNGFPRPKRVMTDLSFYDLLNIDDMATEGYVIRFSSGRRIKIKFQSYKEKYSTMYHV
jgi:8-oxo-dGTP pyrophosphatase MutT (NUDIX family)